METSLPIQSLPPQSSLSTSVLSFLDDKLLTQKDLSRAPSLASELLSQCLGFDKTITDLNARLASTLLAYTSLSNRIHVVLGDASSKLTDLGSLTCSQSDGGKGKEEDEMLQEELPALAKEVARVETVRAYAETALKLDALVGDIEDYVSSAMNKNLTKHSSSQDSNEIRVLAIEALGRSEDVLTSVTRAHPEWMHLVSAVDHRVDRALAIFRPKAIADHRILLASLKWPPPLANLTYSNIDVVKPTEVPNPLFTMQGNLKHQYCENFIALCHLQELQRRRKSRQLEGHYSVAALNQPLWVIEELVNPLSIACQKHFSKWIDKPQFSFALIYKITRDYVDTMDELLQPLVDQARLVGYSCREEWISSMVTSLSMYLAKEIFPVHVGQLDDESVTARSQARISWLHLLDLMISFDKRIFSLLTQSGISLSLEEDENLQKISALSVFCDRPDWLDLWAEIELDDTLEKLKPEVDNARNWALKIQGPVLSGPENYKSPAISSAFLQRLTLVIDRCRSLPTISLRSRFLRLAVVPIIHKFLDCVLHRCQEAEGLTALTDDDALIKVANSINASLHFESVLKEWREDIFFLELGLLQRNQLGMASGESEIDGSGGIFDEEARRLEEFRKEWVEKLSLVVLRGFDAQCRDYIKNRKQWQDKSDEGWKVSKNLVGALDYLQVKMGVIEENLNTIDFVGVWRSLAAGLDLLFFNGILLGNVKFQDVGVQRLNGDLEVMFGVFQAWCLRPEGFFPKLTDSLKLLKMGEQQQQQLRDDFAVGKWMNDNGIGHLSVTEAAKILKSRVFQS